MRVHTKAALLAGASQALLLSLLTAPAAHAAQGAAITDTAADATADTNVSEVVVNGKLVTGPKDTIAVGPLGDRAIVDTPMAISTVGVEQINRLQATTIDQAFAYDASIRTNNAGVASGNTFASRGLTVDLTFGYRYDGLAFPYWYQDQPIESLEGIQVLKGAGGFVYGYASPAGVVNFVSKKPTSEFQSIVDFSYRSSSIWRALVDIGGPVSPGSSTRFRLNVVNEQGTLYNGAYNKDQFASLYLEGEATPKLSWSLNGFYQRTWQAHESNNITLLPWSAANAKNVTYLAPVDGADFNLASPSSVKMNDVSQLTGRLNYQLNADWKISAAMRYADLDERFQGNGSRIIDNQGDYQLGLLDQNRLFHYYVGQVTIDGKFDTGPIHHALVAGYDYLRDDFIYDYQPYTATHIPTTSYTLGVPNGNIYVNSQPSWANNPAALAYQRPPDWRPYQLIREQGLFVSDTLSWGRAELLIGMRYNIYKESDLFFVPPQGFHNENTPTPVIAPSFRIADGVKIYASYVQALQTGGQAPTTAVNSGAILPPLKSTQYEVGIKAERGRWGATFAAYQTNVPADLLEPYPADTTKQVYVEDGEARYRGLELDGHYQLTHEWLLNASVAYMQGIQTKSSPATSYLVGHMIPETVATRAAVFAQYSPNYLPGFTAFGGIRYTGSTYGQANPGLDANKNQIQGWAFYFPSVTVGDVGISYRLPTQRDIEVRANIQNVTNEKYWIPGTTATAISAGAPRTFTIGVSYRGGPGRGGEGWGALPDGRSGWYFGAEAGGIIPTESGYTLVSKLNPALANVPDGVDVKRDGGGDLAFVVGHNFGLFRAEGEVSYDWSSLSQVKLNSVAITQDASGLPVGTYNSPTGSSTTLAFLANGLVNLGGKNGNPWSVEAGGGLGLGRVSNTKWRLQSGAPFFQSDSQAGLAYQAIARVRRKLNDHLDATVTYHYLDVVGLKLRAANANEIHGSSADHGFRAGLTYNF